MLKTTLLGALATCALTLPAAAQDAYVVGITGALTGPPASAPMRRRSRRCASISTASTRPAASTARRSSWSSRTTARAFEGRGQRQEADHAGQRRPDGQREPVLDLRAGDRRDQERRRAAAVRQRRSARRASIRRPIRCSSAPPRYASHYDSRAALDFVKETAKEPVKIGFSAMAIPLSRGEMDYAEEQAKTLGMTPVDKEVIPPPTADYTPFATKIKDAGANWVYLLGAVGDAGAHLRGAAPARLAGRLHRLGASRGRRRAGAHQGRQAST